MACFLVSAAEAAVVGAVEKAEEKKEAKLMAEGKLSEADVSIPLSQKLKWLFYMLVGGSFLLAFEHVWHGEVVPWFPFLTAMSDKADTMEMLGEMSTVGVAMALLITAVWVIMCVAADAIVKRPVKATVKEEK